MVKELKKEIKQQADPVKAQTLARFFKTNKGEYGEGDIFCGITVPQSRELAKKYRSLPFADIVTLLESKVHEERLIALLILVHNFQKNDESIQEQIFQFYMANTRHINNWDLVDISADKIVGGYLKNRDRAILQRLARSASLWERRISMVATFQLIKDLKEYRDTFVIADILLKDDHDLIQKAVGCDVKRSGETNFGKNLGRVSQASLPNNAAYHVAICH